MGTLSKKVFLATSCFLAFIDRAHPQHAQAEAFFRYFAQEGYALFTDSLTIYEVHQKIHSHISTMVSRDFLRTIFFSNINILYPQEAEMKAALKILLSYPSVDLTLEKALMAILASRWEISHICTFDPLHNLFGLTTFYLPI
ncbi:PIN domain-containing protein [Candidatus Gottesmanbacteria bacterium]|nr:PIN domain-containing protein [Candidatus Gottesmanbacteria bacterium]